MIKFGETEFRTSRPADLDAALIEATGCNAAEHAAALARGGTAFHVAQAAAAFINAPIGDIAAAIADDHLVEARASVAALLAPVAPPAKKADA